MNHLDKQIKVAIAGMTFPSEGDEQPLEHLRWHESGALVIDEATVRSWSGEGDKPQLLIGDYEAFMAPRTSGGDQQAAYLNLDGIMLSNLTDLIVYRFGDINVRFYVIGLNAGDIVGWKTSAVQT